MTGSSSNDKNSVAPDADTAWFQWRSRFPDAPPYEIFVAAFEAGQASRSASGERTPECPQGQDALVAGPAANGASGYNPERCGTERTLAASKGATCQPIDESLTPDESNRHESALSSTRERTPADYAIEHGEYLAKAAEGFLDASDRVDELEGAPVDSMKPADLLDAGEARSDHYKALRSAIYEFRKRAERARATQSAKGSSAVLDEVLQVVRDAENLWGDEFTRKYGDVTAAQAVEAVIRRVDRGSQPSDGNGD